jgi:protein-tyrosine phosphatase
MTDGIFRILIVCSGNICRSPVAEQLLRDRLPKENLVVRSAGTVARPGMPMTDEATELSRRYGGEPHAHQATRLTRALVEESDLVLTAERSHRADVVRLHPRASRFTFTLTQFARMVESIDADDLAKFSTPAELVAAAAARRGYVQATSPEADDIADPYRRAQSIYDAAGVSIDAAVATIAAAFTGGQRPQPRP